jgi:hypothetical protein
VLKYPAVLAMSADTILLKLRMMGVFSSYQRRLQKLFHAKRE